MFGRPQSRDYLFVTLVLELTTNLSTQGSRRGIPLDSVLLAKKLEYFEVCLVATEWPFFGCRLLLACVLVFVLECPS